jgi:hypothetical protein
MAQESEASVDLQRVVAAWGTVSGDCCLDLVAGSSCTSTETSERQRRGGQDE